MRDFPIAHREDIAERRGDCLAVEARVGDITAADKMSGHFPDVRDAMRERGNAREKPSSACTVAALPVTAGALP